MINITLQNICDANIPDMADFNRWLTTAVENTPHNSKSNTDVTIRVVDKNESQQLNNDYRSKDKPTNVLSFQYPPIPGEIDMPLGDLVICAEVIELEAKEQGKDLQSHWAHMTIHGALHLLGYDHIDPKEAEIMEQLEIKILSILGISNPY